MQPLCASGSTVPPEALPDVWVPVMFFSWVPFGALLTLTSGWEKATG